MGADAPEGLRFFRCCADKQGRGNRYGALCVIGFGLSIQYGSEKLDPVRQADACPLGVLQKR